ncbi:hypothetical protein BYT27DRAFT_7129978 [Phlegmacium glaucopus]|nr:hypothetical protein BYT27DRAFT_7129978 [Phlegmacium glaucopus]
MKRFRKSAQQNVKKFRALVSDTVRSRSPRPSSDHTLDEVDRQADHSPPTLHAPTSDDPGGQSKSVTPATLVGTQAGAPDTKDDKKLVPTTAVEESLTSPKKFTKVKTTNAQRDLVVLHVAYILQKSSNLQRLILEIVKFEYIFQDCVGFITQLIAASDSPTVAQADVEQAIVMLLKTIKSVDLNDTEKALREIGRSIKEIEIVHPGISTIDQKKDSSCFSNITSKVLGVALPMLEIIKTGSSMIPVPMVHPLIGVVAGFLQAANQACNNFEWMRWLSITAAECVIGIAMRCPEQTEQQWAEAIDTLQRKLSDIVQQAENFCRRSVVSRFLLQGRDHGAIETMKEDLKAAISNFNAQVGMNIKLDLDNMSRNIDSVLLDNLPRLPSHDVSHNHYFHASREKEIQDILQWIEEPDSKRLLWIYGAAGVGKSTLARRLLDHTKNEGILASFASFAIGIDSDPKDLIRMMARELSSLHPGCRSDVVRAIKECSGVHQSLDEYLTHFLVKPITSLAYAGSIVIILDALDEWAYRKPFLEALRVNLPPALSLKFVMTSRYSSDIESIVKGAVRIYELTPVSHTVCRDYFKERFKTLKWYGHEPDSEKLDKLVELADGLLIWAATVCTLVSVSRPNKRPHQILNEITTSSSSLGHGRRMEELYKLALQRLFPDDDPEVDRSRQKIFLSMVALKDTLPLKDFARIVNMFPEFIQDVCSGLRALQTRGIFDDSIVQPAIKLFHASFVDYFGPMDQARDVMADNCIHFFEQVTGPDAIEEPGLSPFRQAERYMGKHWVYHLQEAPLEKRSNFFLDVPSNHLRLWVGCLLSHLFLVRDEYGYGPGSDALKNLFDSLLHTEGITSTPEMLLCGMSTTEMALVSFQKALDLGGIDYQNSNFYTEKPKDAQRWAHVLNGLAIAIEQIQRLSAKPNRENLDVAIDLLKNLITVYAPDVQAQPFLLDNLGLALCTRSEFSGSLEDLAIAISLHTKARDLRQKDSRDYAVSLDNLASALRIRFKYGSHPDDLAEAISLLREVLELRPMPHPLRSMSLRNLASPLLTRFQQGGQASDLEEAIYLHREALNSPHPDQSSSFNNFANGPSDSQDHVVAFQSPDGSMKLERRDELIPRYTESVIDPQNAVPDDAMIAAITRFNFHLLCQSNFNIIGEKLRVKLERLSTPGDNIDISYSPVKNAEDIFTSGELLMPLTEIKKGPKVTAAVKLPDLNHLFGFTLSVFDVQTPLFPYVFGFDASTYEIASFYHPDPTKEGPLRANSVVTIGYGTEGGYPIEFQPNEVTFFKIFVTSKYVDLTGLEQESPFFLQGAGRMPTRPPAAIPCDFWESWIYIVKTTGATNGNSR